MTYLEPVIGGITAFLLGFGWYTVMFGKAWQSETGISDNQAQSDIARTHGLALLMMIIISFGINFVINMHAPEDQTFTHGGFHGLLAALMFGTPAMTINYLYQRKSLKLWLIDVGYLLAFCTLSGAVMAALKLA